MTTINRPNWVKERAECEVRVVFDKLCEEVKTDVEEMQNYISKFLPPHSSIKIEKQSTFLDVLCESDYANTTFHVQFQLNKADKLISSGDRRRWASETSSYNKTSLELQKRVL